MTESALQPFHLAFPVHDLEAARHFYESVLGCAVGRTDARWIDFNFFGHQITAHLVGGEIKPVATNAVDNEKVPSRHFGIILEMDGWQQLADRLKEQNSDFLIEPTVRFRGGPGEQATLFIRDPSGNVLEFKAFADPDRIFATD